jgi:NADH-quinone oxidoreductase subunit N|tara:strand:+ start:1123 stop:2568 length:1446 start_codon:yes stop_codon:yes gene_type:complete
MENNFIDFLLFPELALSLGILSILILGLFIKKNVFSVINNLSILLLLFVGFLIFYDNEFNFANFYFFFNDSSFIIYFQCIIIFGSISSLIISSNYYKDLKLLKFEIPLLILFSTLGMLVLVGSNNLITMFLGIELQSLALYILAAINRDSLKSSEAGVKYFVLGALSSGILLYGCSLIYGFTASTNFEDIAKVINNYEKVHLGIIFGLIFVLAGLAFKISAVPFHMWTPDVYEGSPTSVTAFFAIVPKMAGIAIIYRFCLEPFLNFQNDWRQIIIFLSIASMFLGAIAAISQSNIKRLLAYSSIGHIGYILIGLVSASEMGIKGAVVYSFIYVLMNISIFAIMLSLKYQDKYVENIKDLSGISKANPIISICIAIIMFSMAGIPPFAGFFGKFYIFMAALESNLYILAVLGAISSVISAFYYLRIVKIIYFDDLEDKNYHINLSSKSKLILFFSILIISGFVIYPSIVTNIASSISFDFFT